jgi:hypothetical protein
MATTHQWESKLEEQVSDICRAREDTALSPERELSED